MTQILLRGDHVVTMNPSRDVIRDGAVLVVDDVVREVGTWSELRSRSPTRR